MMWSNGISPEPNSLKVTAAGNMQVAVGYGGANLEGRFYWLLDDGTGILKLSIPPADPTYDRIDRIVLRLDLSAAERKNLGQGLAGYSLSGTDASGSDEGRQCLGIVPRTDSSTRRHWRYN